MAQKSRFNYTIEAFHQGVTGSCIQICLRSPYGEITRILVDCGLFQEKEYGMQNAVLPFYAEKIDSVLVTHNHADHIGRLPLLVKNGLKAPIYSSNTNCSLMPPALVDNCKVLKSIAKMQKSKCIYSEDDVDKTISIFHGCAWEQTVKFNENIRYTFFMNGHLVGASLILIQFSYPGFEDINLLLTGDYNDSNIFLSVPRLPKWVLDLPLTVVIESTYGDRDSSSIKYCFDKNVIQALKSNASVICPVFSQGRAQEVLHELKCLQENGDLSRSIPIFLDGNLAIKYTEKYKNCPDVKPTMKNFLPDNFSYVDKDLREYLLTNQDVKIILTSSGMGSYGPAQVYLPEYITRKNALIHFTGYCAPDTLGARLKNAKNGEAVNIGGRLLKKRAQVEFTSEFSAHCKSNQLVSFLNQFSQLKMVLVNHGEPTVKEAFATRVLNECDAKSVGILGNGYTFRLDRYGFVKSLPAFSY